MILAHEMLEPSMGYESSEPFLKEDFKILRKIFHKVEVTPSGNPIRIGKNGIGKLKPRGKSRCKNNSVGRFEICR